jgi:hypothetical protein
VRCLFLLFQRGHLLNRELVPDGLGRTGPWVIKASDRVVVISIMKAHMNSGDRPYFKGEHVVSLAIVLMHSAVETESLSESLNL